MICEEIKFSDVLCQNAAKRPARDAILCMGEKCAYSELYDKSRRFAALLLRAGLMPGEHVAVYSTNSINWLAATFGVILAGGVAALINYALPQTDVSEQIAFADARFVLHGKTRALERDPNALNALEIGSERIIDMDRAALADISDAEDTRLRDIARLSDSRRTAILIFTTGTSAKPKAVMLSQYALLNSARAQCGLIKDDAGARLCLALPLYHCYGFAVCLVYLMMGATICLPESLKPDAILRSADENAVSDMASVGALYAGLLAHAEFEEKLAPRLRLCFIGGGFSTPVQMMRLETSFRYAKFINGYGQTECSPYITVPRINDSLEKRARTVGVPMTGISVKIFDAAGGFLPEGQIGEVVVKGYNLMNGYYKLPIEKQAIDAEGWLHTGDLGAFDEDGYLCLYGRIKDVIIRSGENISPTDVEKALAECPQIRAAKVFGAPHNVFGESVEACVILNDDAGEEAIRLALQGKLASHKTPAHFFRYDEFPLSANGKLDECRLRADMLNRLNELIIRERLSGGITIASLTMKNTRFMIMPVANLLSTLGNAIQFCDNAVARICHAAEEMLIERIEYAGEDVGDITVQITLTKDYLRVRFTDSGKPYDLEKSAHESAGAKIITRMVDHFATVTLQDGKSASCMDFAYDQAFDMGAFLLAHVSNSASFTS